MGEDDKPGCKRQKRGGEEEEKFDGMLQNLYVSLF